MKSDVAIRKAERQDEWDIRDSVVFSPCRLCPRANPFILLNESISS